MKVQIEKLPASKIKLNIEVSSDIVDQYIDKAYIEVSKHLKIPGFRPGHIPKNIVEQKAGSRVIHDEAVRLLIPYAYVEAIGQEKILAIGRPEISVKKFAPNNPAEFEAIVPVVPEVKLGDYKKVKVERKDVNIESLEVEEMLKNLQKRESILKPKEGSIEEGDWAEIDFDGHKKGILLEKLKSRNHPLIVGEKVFMPEFEQNLIGLKAGDEKEFDVQFPPEHFEKDIAGENIHFKIKIHMVQEIKLPELDDEFAKRISGGAEKDLEGLKKDIENALFKQKTHEERNRVEQEVIKQLNNYAEIDIPHILIDDEVKQMKKDLESRLSTQGLKISRYIEYLGKTEEQFDQELKEGAKERIKTGLVLNKIAEVENIDVSDQETDEEIKKTRSESEEKLSEEAKKKLQSEEMRRYIKTVLKNRKTLDKLIDYATA
ncbi:trigger factor [bacterium CG_4_8_14_3_um_filter_33_28]|nr:MAG: trigger factor [bacterium CG_4_8_14_3_um_filter_33_28]